ncbi:MAG: alpha-galactosidase [Spirochaetes bacterium]|nr:alpha-galactosidase [Spirochaetota bacterium]
MAKIVIIGAGSAFGPKLARDMLSIESLADSVIALCDINKTALDETSDFLTAFIAHNKLTARIEKHTDYRKLLSGADVVVTSIAVGGQAYDSESYKAEIAIPAKYGVRQNVGDTVGVGGVFRFLRTAPVMHDICRAVEELCPDAMLLNYTNPMAMLTWMHSTMSSVKNVGLCHSVQHTANELAKYIGVPPADVMATVAGINHQAWILEYKHINGNDLYPAVRDCLNKPDILAKDRIRFEMMRHFGYFITESSRHNAEYVPYFMRTKAAMDAYALEEHRFIKNPSEKAGERPRDVFRWIGGKDKLTKTTSEEYASRIVEGIVTGSPFVFGGNVMNTGLIENLPAQSCVEVPCIADRHGVRPVYAGKLPPQCAAINMTNIAVQELAVEAFRTKKKESAFLACALDPLTAASATLDDIRKMTDEIIAAEGGLLDYLR